MDPGPPNLFIGVGVSDYANHETLSCAVDDVCEVATLIGFGQKPTLRNPSKLTAESFLQDCENSLPDGGVVVFEKGKLVERPDNSAEESGGDQQVA